MSESTPDAQTQNTEPQRPDPSPGDTPPPADGDTAPTEHQLDPASPSQTAGNAAGPAGGRTGDSAGDMAGGISDDQLPEDLQPTDDNPLAQPLDEDQKDTGLSIGGDGPQP